MKFSLSPKAKRDLEEIADYIAQDNPARAVTFLDDLLEHCRLIASRPAAFPIRTDIAVGLRMGVHGNYLILFRVQPRRVRVERILHGARNLKSLFEEEL